MGSKSDMGGAATPQATGANPGLAQAFMGNKPTQGAQVPQIMQPQSASLPQIMQPTQSGLPDIAAMLAARKPGVQPVSPAPAPTAPANPGSNAIFDMRGNPVPQSQDYHKMSPVRQARHRRDGR